MAKKDLVAMGSKSFEEFPYAAPKSKIECFCREIFNCKKLVYTFDTPVNNHLIDMGVMSLDVDSFILNPVAFHLARESDG
jgi:hypothetical protein